MSLGLATHNSYICFSLHDAIREKAGIRNWILSAFDVEKQSKLDLVNNLGTIE